MNHCRILAAAALLAACGCIQVKTESEIKPIHITMDVNLKVDKELDRAFADENAQKPKGDYKAVKEIVDRKAAGVTNRALLEAHRGGERQAPAPLRRNREEERPDHGGGAETPRGEDAREGPRRNMAAGRRRQLGAEEVGAYCRRKSRIPSRIAVPSGVPERRSRPKLSTATPLPTRLRARYA